jgi:hypothetical protein
MAVSTMGKRFVLCGGWLAAALLATLVLAAAALGTHYSPGQPGYLTAYPVAGSADNWIASDADASWVADVVPAAAPGQSTLRVFRIPANADPVTTTDVATLPSERVTVEGITTTPGAVWVGVTELTEPPTTPTTKVFKVGQTTPVVVHAGANLTDIVTGAGNTVWFLETLGSTQTQIGKIDSATSTPTTYPVLAGRTGGELAAGAEPDALVWFTELLPGNVMKLASFDPAAVAPANPIKNEIDIARCEPSCSPVHGPEGALWFLEATAAGTSITKMALAGTVGELTRHPFSTIFPTDLAAVDGAEPGLWFTTGFQGNIGLMAPDGTLKSLLCIGSGHPSQISAGPGANITFTQQRPADEVGRVSTTVQGSPCPPRPVPPAGGSRGGGRKATPKDTTPAKISLSGKASQRFSKAGTIVISVQSNEDCAARVQATVSTGGASKVFRSQLVTKRLVGGKRTKVTLKFRKGGVKAIRRALRRKKRLKANVNVSTQDRSGNRSSAKRSIKLKR